MDIGDYLKEEFEAYPRYFRDVSEYLAKKNVIKALTECPDDVTCPICNASMTLVDKTVKKGVRYNYQCSSCGKVSGPLQKAPFIAFWQLNSANDCNVINPLLNIVLYNNKLSKWTTLNQTEKLQELLIWATSLTWLKWVWNKHRLSSSYNKLSDTDKLAVDSLGFCIDELRRKSVLLLSITGFDIKDSRNTTFVKLAYDCVKKERSDMFSKFKDKLSFDFSMIVKNELFTN